MSEGYAEELVTTQAGQLPATFSGREWPRPWMGAFLDSMAMSPNVSAAARAAGVNRQYVYESRDKWPDFAEGWLQAQKLGADVIEANALRWATVGQDTTEVRERFDHQGNLIERNVVKSKMFSPTITLAVLRRWKPEYRESQVTEHQGAGGGAVRLEVDRVPTRERMLELARLAQEYGLPPGVAPVIEAADNGAGNGHVNGDGPDV